MNYSVKQRILMYICSKIGHKLDIHKAWVYNGVHCRCDRCNFTISQKDND